MEIWGRGMEECWGGGQEESVDLTRFFEGGYGGAFLNEGG